MAGGTWTSQNKVRPGVYIRFQSANQSGLTVGERGTVAIAEQMNWGPTGGIMEIAASDNMIPYTGYDITNENNRFLSEIFKGSNRTNAPQKVLLYRLTGTGALQASATVGGLTVTAKYPGTRGNDITVVITEETDSTFTVSTVVDQEIADRQTGVSAISGLQNNEWVTWSGTGALTASTGAPLTGGLNGTVSAAAYTSFLTAVEPYKFDVMIYDGSDTAVMSAMVSFIKRIAEESGAYAQLVAANFAAGPDSRFVVNVTSGAVLEDGKSLTAAQTTWWVGGALAGAAYNQSLTYAAYPGAVAATPKMTNSQYVEALKAGQFVLFSENGAVKVEQDINTLVTYTEEIGEVFRKNRVMRLCSTIANDIYSQFSANFIGVVNNNEQGRSRFKGVIVGYLLDIQANQGIQNFDPADVEVLPGDAIDSIVINVAIQATDSVEKIYMTIQVS